MNLKEVLGIKEEDILKFRRVLFEVASDEEWVQRLESDENLMRCLVLMPFIVDKEVKMPGEYKTNALLALALFGGVKGAVEAILKKSYRADVKILVLYSIGKVIKEGEWCE